MAFRTKTSGRTMKVFKDFEIRDHLQPYALAKISIALAIKSGFKFDEKNKTDMLGLDLNRQTITGEYDLLFKALIEMNEGKSFSDEEYFPDVLKSYLDEGAVLLEQEYKYSQEFYTHLVELEKGI